MPRFMVNITGTWLMELDAEDAKQAEEFAYQQCLDDGIDVELMNLEFEAYREEEENA